MKILIGKILWCLSLAALAVAAMISGCVTEGDTEKVVPEEPQEILDVSDIDDPWLRPGRVREWTGDLDGMLDRGFIRVLTPANRAQYFVDGAQERGIAADIASALEEKVNSGLPKSDHIRVVCIPVRQDKLIPMLRAGLGDVAMGNLTVNEERASLVLFTSPVVNDVRELVVTAPGQEPINSLADLAGKEVWVPASSSYFDSLQRLNQEFLKEGREPIDVKTTDPNLQDGGILEMVNAKLYPATVMDSHKLDWLWSEAFPDLQVSDVAIREDRSIAVAVRKDSPRLKEVLDQFYDQYRPGTKMGNMLIDQYVRKSKWILNATETAERKKFNAVVDYFRKYANQYDFDYLMMMAQGYQESGLDPDARSHVGAIGIMQIMPETAAGEPLNMPDVSDPEVNIHAGIKYMRYIVDQYFDGPELDEVNRHLFAFAAYNAGPNRIARLRELAPEYGVDENQWFKNVERIVASKVGQEPVRYVGNVYKYYLAYRRLQNLEGGQLAQDLTEGQHHRDT